MGGTMTNHPSGLGTADEIHRILPVLADLSPNVVGKGQEHHTAAGQRADAAELEFPYRRISERTFARRPFGLADSEGERGIAKMMPQTEESAGKIFLPSRSNESRFAPQQYYYPASKSGVVPSWAIPAAARLE
jgi:hypothetical protein